MKYSCFKTALIWLWALSAYSSVVLAETRTEHLPADAATTPVISANSFEQRSATITDIGRIRAFNIGNDFFANPWVPNRASTSNRDGLGPLLNSTACQNCHIRDGRGQLSHQPEQQPLILDNSSLLIRTARGDITPEQRQQQLRSQIANVGDTAVGGQLQQRANPGIQPEGVVSVSYQPQTVTFADGYSVELRKPVWTLTSTYDKAGIGFDKDTIFSPRNAPPMIGLGLLSLIAFDEIVANSDKDDRDGDGISGRANWVWNEQTQAVSLGRFGWKAGQPTIAQQAAGAFLNDMGLTSKLFPTEVCMPHQQDCLKAPNGNGDSTGTYAYEVADKVFDNIEFYSWNLAVPQRRNAYGPEVQRGKQLFFAAGCAGCHREQYTTGTRADFPELSQQTIYPYTDMLLHDMGPALADFTIDNNPAAEDAITEFLATAREWRTPPLWGLGLTQVVNPKATFLHDGRARTIMEAVLWHGGEAENARQAVLRFDQSQRNALLAFLEDL